MHDKVNKTQSKLYINANVRNSLDDEIRSWLWCITTKHGYQSKRTYGKVVRKQKMDSYIVR
jgi:hypothetical protein